MGKLERDQSKIERKAAKEELKIKQKSERKEFLENKRSTKEMSKIKSKDMSKKDMSKKSQAEPAKDLASGFKPRDGTYVDKFGAYVWDGDGFKMGTSEHKPTNNIVTSNNTVNKNDKLSPGVLSKEKD